MGAASLHEPCLYTDTRSGSKPKDETAKKTNTNFLFKLVKYELFFHKNHKTVRAQVKFMTWFIFFRLEQLAREVIVSGEQVINQKKAGVVCHYLLMLCHSGSPALENSWNSHFLASPGAELYPLKDTSQKSALQTLHSSD